MHDRGRIHGLGESLGAICRLILIFNHVEQLALLDQLGHVDGFSPLLWLGRVRLSKIREALGTFSAQDLNLFLLS